MIFCLKLSTNHACMIFPIKKEACVKYKNVFQPFQGNADCEMSNESKLEFLKLLRNLDVSQDVKINMS